MTLCGIRKAQLLKTKDLEYLSASVFLYPLSISKKSSITLNTPMCCL